MAIEKALGSKNADITSLIDDWWETFTQNEGPALKEIVELIFHTAGYKSFVFVPDDFPSKEVQNQMREKGDVSSSLEIMSEDEAYTVNFKLFFVNLFNYRARALLYRSDFIQPILKTIYTLIQACWDSFRITAAITGTEIMSIVFKEEVLLNFTMNSLSTESSGINSDETVTTKVTFLKELGHDLFTKIYRPSSKDCSKKIRKMMTARLVEWTANCPEKILRSNWHLYVIRVIRDPNMEVRELAFMALFNLLARKIQEAKQTDLFRRTKTDILAVVNTSDLGEIAMKILCSVIRFSEAMVINTNERENIYINIYDPKGSVAILAGQFLYFSNFISFTNCPEAIIFTLVQFNEESMYKSYSLLVDSMYTYIYPYLKWDDWYKVIRKSDPEKISEVLALFLAYISKATLDYVPKYRKSIARLTKEEMANNIKSFTEYFNPHLLTLLFDVKIKLRPDALHKIIKLPQLFSASIQIQNAKEVVEVICEIMKVSSDKKLMMECSSSLASLEAKCQEQDPMRGQALKSVISSLIDTSISDFLDYLNVPVAFENPDAIENRVLSLCKFHDFDDRTLWKYSLNKMENFADGVNSSMVLTTMSVLQQLLLRKVLAQLQKNEENENNEGSDDDSQRDEIILCTERYLAFKNICKKYLKPDTNEEIIEVAFSSMVELLKVFGPHVSNHSALKRFRTEEDIDLINGIIECTFHRITTKHCSTDTNYSSLKPDSCCCMLKKTCALISQSIINVIHFEKILVLTGKNALHDNVIVTTLKQQVIKLPNQWLPISVVIFNTLMTSLGVNIREGKSLSQCIKELQEMLGCLLNPKKIDKSSLRPITLNLYIEIVGICVGKSFFPLLALLETLIPTLSPADLPHLVSTLETYKVKELDENIALLKRLLVVDGNNLSNQPNISEEEHAA